MTGIVGVFNHDFAPKLVSEGLKIIASRVDSPEIYGEDRSALGDVYFREDSVIAEDRSRAGYAMVRWQGEKVTIERDIIGVKPLFYSLSDGFAVSSERKVLLKLGFNDTFELNPREIISYDIMEGEATRTHKEFFPQGAEHQKERDAIKSDLKALILRSIKSNIPDEHFGLLLSGGVDSTLLAVCLKQIAGAERFTCYCAGISGAKDVEFAREAARKHGLNLSVIEVDTDDVESYLPEIIELVEDSSAMKAGVGLPILIAARRAKKDGITKIFVGNGADELFGGYGRHIESKDLNRDCFSDMLSYYERNGYRDDVIAANEGVEFLMPFLDPELIEYALKIPPELKIRGNLHKVILREVAVEIGLDEAFAFRKKTAAQYGSGFDRTIAKLARKNGYRSKSQYLRQFLGRENLRLGVLYSSGKDSTYAMYLMQMQNYSVECLITLRSKNPSSYMFHTPAIDLVPDQAKLLGIPLIIAETDGEEGSELQDLEKALLQGREEYKIEGIVTGALYSNYQRDRIEMIADRLGLKVFSPLWHIDQEHEMREILRAGFKFIFTAVAAEGLDDSWIGRQIDDTDIDRLVELNERYGINIAGEGGEFESLVIAGPNFKGELVIQDFEIIDEGMGAWRMTVRPGAGRN
ncbi:MAG: asparagine synthetase [Candidatus Syntrophoarchaeum caldarius]|uniref:Asparagine synthetase n=1 Tax=Candidatus Syntropharchaeum caldarium TaxID=1838285 RepID=A0A1F2P8N8_9EURY|nr:MAG: asparagine synthetase [Candidatus Syntrophoarchaeum caldarius]